MGAQGAPERGDSGGAPRADGRRNGAAGAARRERLAPGAAESLAAAASLASALRRRIEGDVRFDDGYRALYATDASNYRQVPIGVVVPRTLADVVETVALCREHDAPIVARGGGTSLAGQCCNTAVVIDFSKHLRGIVSLDTEARRAVVEPGCVLDDLRAAAEKHHLTFGPDPSTHDHNTLGGMIGNNSCGVHALMAGKTSDNVQSLEVVTYDGTRLNVGPTSEDTLARYIAHGGRRGEIYAALRGLRDRYAAEIRARYPRIPRRVSGYNLDELLPENGFNVARALVGSEGTCVTVLSAELRLVPSPPCRTLVVLGYPDVYSAADHVPEILEHKPIGLEALDDRLLRHIEEKHMGLEGRKLLPDGGGWLLVELGADDRDASVAAARALMHALEHAEHAPTMRLCPDSLEEHELWEVREAGLGATARLQGHPDAWPGWEDAAVPPDKLGGYLREFRALLDRYRYECSLYGHFGQGCVHVRIDFDLGSRAGIAQFKAFTSDAADLVVRYGGSLSGEHGDGQARADLLPKMFGEELVGAFREFKRIFDPGNRMNPGKVVDPFPRDSNLRLGADFRLPKLDTVFTYGGDDGSFGRATLRCVGVGKCRHIDKGVMCPSYMATREEMHSTRGRARLLFEMVRGMEAGQGLEAAQRTEAAQRKEMAQGMTHVDAPIKDGWRSAAVHEALELCLSCKGCLRDCPVDVDMATYKAEFNYHHYARRLRPRAAYSMGFIYWWLELASRAPKLANFLCHAPVIANAAKGAAGIARERRLPRFAARTFKEWFAGRGADAERAGGARSKVVLWPDTFNNHLHPEILTAAVEVLDAAGFDVEVPTRSLCCGRPLYAWGMLDLAKRQLRGILSSLERNALAGVPIVGVEPACVSTFRDELPRLFPNDERARRLSKQTFMLGEFLGRQEDYSPPRLERRALVHRHCHHHAMIGFEGDAKILEKMGLDAEVLDSGCCGMAGPFGFEANHYELSLKIGERVLLPAVRRASADTLILTDGYACREQISQSTGRRAVHLAQVLARTYGRRAR